MLYSPQNYKKKQYLIQFEDFFCNFVAEINK